MLIKLPINRLKDRLSDMTSIADKMEAINTSRIQKLIEIGSDRDHTSAWKRTQAERYEHSPEVDALNSQMRLLVGVMDEQKKLWRDSATLLRDVAVPRRDAMGTDAFMTSTAELSFLMTEAAALSLNAGALQSALDRAVAAEDWRAVYALTLGRIDSTGRALNPGSGLDGTPLEALPLPGRDDAEELFHQCDLEAIRADGVMLSLSSRDLNPTAVSSGTNLERQSALLMSERKYQNAIKQRDRLRAAPSALERWELLKDGAQPEPTFADRVRAASARAQAAGLDGTLR